MTPPSYRNVLCIRADNMGDVIMSSPAMRALKASFESRITLLTSPAGAIVVPYLDCVDDVIVAALPWVKSDGMEPEALLALAETIRSGNFDAAVIFTVYSQSALPAATLAYLAGIPVRVAYARENPYGLLTHWVPDLEPYQRISHQVQRDLELVQTLGATAEDDRLALVRFPADALSLHTKLEAWHIAHEPLMVLHPGVSEAKREYPEARWIGVGKLLAEHYPVRLLISGSSGESDLAGRIAAGIGSQAVSVAGLLNLGEFIQLLAAARCIVSVNTGTIHIAAAVQTPAVVLYAQTNPQHAPWKSAHELLPFSVPVHLRSKNPIIQDVADRLYAEFIPYPGPEAVLAAVEKLNVPVTRRLGIVE